MFQKLLRFVHEGIFYLFPTDKSGMAKNITAPMENNTEEVKTESSNKGLDSFMEVRSVSGYG